MQIRWTKKAKQNLLCVEKYIAEDNPTAAIKTVLKIIEKIGILAEHPNVGRSGRVFGTQELVISGSPYLVIYRIKINCVEILRVLHSAMPWPDSI